MNKKIIFGMMIACGLLSVACVNEVEEVFDTQASERLDQRMLECQSLLTSAEYGWLIEYYPDPHQSYGGSTYTAKFDADGSVTVTGEIAEQVSGNVSKTITSHYSINASSSVTLTFDTYNEYIHYWSDPDDYSGNLYEGDFEFAYVNGDEERMVFRGIKTGNQIVFTALSTDIVTSAQQIVAIQEEVVDNLYLGYKWDSGDTNAIELYDDDNYNLLTYYPDGNKNGAYETIPYSYTPEGIAFYKATTIAGITVQKFKWENNAFVSTDAVDASGIPATVSMTGFHSDSFLHYDTFIGTYTLTYKTSANASSYVSRTVTLSEGTRYSSFILTGLSSRFPMEVDYSKSDGSLSLTTQYLGRYNSYYVYLCPSESARGGYYTWGAGIGFTLTHNGDPENLVLTFADNGVWSGYVVTNLLVQAFSGSPSGTTSLGYLERFYMLNTMTKQ